MKKSMLTKLWFVTKGSSPSRIWLGALHLLFLVNLEPDTSKLVRELLLSASLKSLIWLIAQGMPPFFVVVKELIEVCTYKPTKMRIRVCRRNFVKKTPREGIEVVIGVAIKPIK